MKTAGIEVSNVASELLMMQWALRGRMHYREALHFLHNEADGLQYILFADPDRLVAGHDIVDYLRLLNDRYGHADDPRLTLDDLRRQTLVTLVNPLTGLALYTLLGSYLIRGEGSGAVPMIHLGGDTRMLPLLRYGLTPFGPEYGLAAVAGGAGRSLRLYGRVGDGRFERSWGVGARVHGLVRSEAVTVGGSVDVWQQPGFHAGGPKLEWREGGMGWGADASLAWYPAGPRLGAYGRIGYKTAGFVPGEPLDRGPTLRLGISVREP